eukprot:6206767-Pleurochrysis_carterae.AAC.3
MFWPVGRFGALLGLSIPPINKDSVELIPFAVVKLRKHSLGGLVAQHQRQGRHLEPLARRHERRRSMSNF